MGGVMIDSDIRSQSGSYVHELFQDRIATSEKNALETWLSAQIQSEREGWKHKLQVSMKEIERNRKLILDLDDMIQAMNAKMEPRVQDQLYGEETPFVSTDSDNKTSNLNRLQSNIDLLVNRMVNMEEEFTKCWELLLGVEVEDIENIPLSEIIKTKIDTLEAEIIVSDAHMNWKVRVENLQDEVKHLRETMAYQQRILREERKLRDQLLSQTRSKEQSIEILQHLENRLQVTNTSVQTESVQTANKGVLFRHEGLTRLNRGIQTLISISIPNHKPQSNTIEDFNNMDPERISTGKSIVSSRTMENQVSDLSGESNKHTDEIPDTMNMHKFLELDMNSSLQTMNNKIRGQNNSIQNLRSQVVDFAKSLEKAREEITYQQQSTISKKQTTPSLVSNSSRMQNQESHQKNTGSDTQNRFNESSYLGGVSLSNSNKKGSLPFMPETRQSLTSVVNGGLSKPETNTSSQSTSKCLRCHKVYKIKDNHKLACKYHPKSRKKIEKYDANGKLAKVVFIWECCSNKSEALGCCNGEHL